MLGDKHIPQAYLRASEAQRRDLLAGLLDTDGTVLPSGAVQLATTSERLVRDERAPGLPDLAEERDVHGGTAPP